MTWFVTLRLCSPLCSAGYRHSQVLSAFEQMAAQDDGLLQAAAQSLPAGFGCECLGKCSMFRRRPAAQVSAECTAGVSHA
jgi:hypothetical protein